MGLVVVAVLFTVGPIVGLLSIAHRVSRDHAWTRTTGTITQLRQGSDSPDGTLHGYGALIATYEYRDQVGQVHVGSGSPGRQSIAVGDGSRTIELLVNPLEPSESTILGADGPESNASLVIICLAFLLVGIFLVYLAVAAA